MIQWQYYDTSELINCILRCLYTSYSVQSVIHTQIHRIDKVIQKFLKKKLPDRKVKLTFKQSVSLWTKIWDPKFFPNTSTYMLAAACGILLESLKQSVPHTSQCSPGHVFVLDRIPEGTYDVTYHMTHCEYCLSQSEPMKGHWTKVYNREGYAADNQENNQSKITCSLAPFSSLAPYFELLVSNDSMYLQEIASLQKLRCSP